MRTYGELCVDRLGAQHALPAVSDFSLGDRRGRHGRGCQCCRALVSSRSSSGSAPGGSTRAGKSLSPDCPCGVSGPNACRCRGEPSWGWQRRIAEQYHDLTTLVGDPPAGRRCGIGAHFQAARRGRAARSQSEKGRPNDGEARRHGAKKVPSRGGPLSCRRKGRRRRRPGSGASSFIGRVTLIKRGK